MFTIHLKGKNVVKNLVNDTKKVAILNPFPQYTKVAKGIFGRKKLICAKILGRV